MFQQITSIPFDMNILSGFPQPVRRQSMNFKGLLLMLVLGAVTFMAGCGKKETPAPVTTSTATPATNNNDATPETAQPVSQNTVTPATPAATPITPSLPQVNPAEAAKADAELPALVQLNRAVIDFRMRYNRNPKSVEEAESATGVKLPPPPAGKKYAFTSRGLIELVDSSTK
jgi:hypothetical protein